MGKNSKKKNRTPKKLEPQISPEYKKTKLCNRFASLNTELEESLDMESDTGSDLLASAGNEKQLTNSINSSAEKEDVNKILTNVLTTLKSIESNIKSVQCDVSQIKETQSSILNKIQTLENRITVVENKTASADSAMDEFQSKVNGFAKTTDSISETVNRLDRLSKERQLRLINFPESKTENCVSVVHKLLYEKFDLDIPIESAYRMGKVMNGGKPRHIVFKVARVSDKHDIFKMKRYALRNEDYYIVEDLTRADLAVKKQLQPEMDQLRSQGKRFKFRDGKLMVQGAATSNNSGPPKSPIVKLNPSAENFVPTKSLPA